jgi:hypothetical protein
LVRKIAANFNFKILLHKFSVVIILCYKHDIKSFIVTVAEPKKTHTEVLHVPSAGVAFF